MGRWWVALLFVAACIDSSSITCADGTVCPGGFVCAAVTNPTETLCVLQDQLDTCRGMPDHSACHTPEVSAGRCYDGACLAIACGNGRVDSADPNVPGDVGEACDDHNNISGDGCSADCLSDETCGNGVVDGVKFEQCDDGNLVDHDGCDSQCLPEAPAWGQLSLDVIDARSTPMAYDVEHQQIVLFGGDNNQPSADTWLWNGLGWAMASPAASPTARTGHATAYDASRHRVVVFGGDTSSILLSDTWEWDGQTWRAIGASMSPPPRFGAMMAYDARRKKIVLFGGSHHTGLNTSVLGDTWEWDGTVWTQITTAAAPSARSGSAMGFDPIRGTIVLFGGGNGNGINVYGDTWEYDGTNWLMLTPATSPGGRRGASLAWDAMSRALLLFGGNNFGPDLDETWSWTGTTWVQVVVATRPTGRSFPGMAFDAARERIVVFGGSSDNPPTTWTWNGVAWSNATPPAPEAQHQSQIAFDSARGRAVMLDALGLTWESDGGGWTSSAQTPLPLREDVAMAYDAARAQTVLFGGTTETSSTGLAETWLWNGETWTKSNPASSPSGRVTAMAYDAARGRVVLFGGAPDPTLPPTLGDTWEWDGATWTPQTPADHPPARFDHAMIYDPIRAQVVLFGGSSTSGPTSTQLADTWTWDGVDWTQRSPAHAPSAPVQAAFAWNASRRTAMLFGGSSANGVSAEVWEWNGVDWAIVNAGSTPLPRNRAAAFPSRDGAGLVIFGGASVNGGNTPISLSDSWRLRWDGNGGGESCATDDDLDGDQLGGCKDPDCWFACTPTCPPGTSCIAGAPNCGDGTCNAALENCRSCPEDCGACTAVCGDSICDPSESTATCPGDCPP